MKIKILYVEDNPFDVIQVARALDRGNLPPIEFVLTDCDRLETARELAADAHLVLLDLGLPDSPTAATIGAIADLAAPVVVVSGDSRRALQFRAGAAAYGFCSKLAVAAELLPAIYFALGRAMADMDPAEAAELRAALELE